MTPAGGKMSDKEYSLFSDKDLVAMAGHGDLAAEEYLLNKYSSLVRYEIRFLYIAGAEVEDLMQEGMIGLFTAIRSYDIESDVQFSTFATTCIRNKVKTYITSANRKKHIPLNTYISIYSGEDEEDEDAGRIRVALIGRPNAGKSSLTNKMSGSDRSIVSSVLFRAR